jgi:signal transduction histidine kinase/CheY-like chemotaxis protein
MPPRWFWAILGAGGILSLCLFLIIRSWEQQEMKTRAADLAQEQVERLRLSVFRSMEVLHSIAALHAASGKMEHSPFSRFVQNALSRQPELAALSWNPLVHGAERTAFETAVRAEYPDFQLREFSLGGPRQPAGTREKYVPVQFIEPFASNAVALGYDLNSDPRRQTALELACDSAQPVATAPIKLAQGPDDQPGMLVLMPVFHAPMPVTVDERRAQLAGFAVAVFRVGNLVQDVFKSLEEKGIQVRLMDTSPDGQQLYASAGEAETQWGAAQRSVAHLEMAGRRWTVTFAPTRQFAAGQSHMQSWLVLFGGLVLTGLASAYLLMSWRRAEETAHANAMLQEEVAIRQRAEASAEAANRAKSDFLASMSHEIRTPLNAILGYTQLMQREPRLQPEQRDAITAINASGRHLLGLINEILDLSKIEAGRMELNAADFDVMDLADELEATFRPLCNEKRLRFRLETSEGAATRVHGDEGKLRQVLINLLGNALKFTKSGEVYLGIKTAAQGHWLFEVIDTGIGIADDEQKDIFKAFQQGKGQRHHSGTGLGLAIASRQVELLGGTLEVQSQYGFGSRFHFTIPLPPAHAAAPEITARKILRLSPGQNIRALVVDDNRSNRDVLAGLLADVGCEVVLAANAEEALKKIHTAAPSIVFLDLLLPDQTGTDVTIHLKREPATANLPVVMHTASALAQHREEAMAAGCVDFITKPVALERLCKCLEQHVGARFEFSDTQQPLDDTPRLELDRVVLPQDLYSRLTLAAEVHSTTALKAALQDLRDQSEPGQQLAEEIRHYMRSYDMVAIQRLLTEHAVAETAVLTPP